MSAAGNASNACAARCRAPPRRTCMNALKIEPLPSIDFRYLEMPVVCKPDNCAIALVAHGPRLIVELCASEMASPERGHGPAQHRLVAGLEIGAPCDRSIHGA
jgi:hypothetical protein